MKWYKQDFADIILQSKLEVGDSVLHILDRWLILILC